MTAPTNSQRMAQVAFQQISLRNPTDDFASFARSFPSLIHACGLAQAVAFANAKKKTDYLVDLAAVLSTTVGALERNTREQPVSVYIRLTYNALEAAGWLKRYVEALKKK